MGCTARCVLIVAWARADSHPQPPSFLPLRMDKPPPPPNPINDRFARLPSRILPSIVFLPQMLAPIVYGCLGTSLQLLTGPTAVMSILTRAAVPATWAGQPVPAGSEKYVELGALLAFTVGVMQLVLHMLRATFLVRLISAPVLLGFTSASAFVVASTQFSNLLGLPKCVGNGGGSCNFVQSVTNLIDKHGKITWAPPVASLLFVILLVSWKRLTPKLLPRKLHLLRFAGPLVLVVLSISLMAAYPSTWSKIGIAPVERIPAGLPTPSHPFPSSITAADVGTLIMGAIPPGE